MRSRTRSIGVAAALAVSLVLSGCSVVETVLGGLLGVTGPEGDLDLSEPTEDADAGDAGDAGETGGPGETRSIALVAGDCVYQSDLMAPVITDVEAIPCDGAHDGEVYATGTLYPGAYPGEDGVWVEADDFCHLEFTTFVGVPYVESSLSFFSLPPSEDDWAADDRAVWCVLFDPQGEVTGSLQGSAR